jgi:hypothetical protein
MRRLWRWWRARQYVTDERGVLRHRRTGVPLGVKR